MRGREGEWATERERERDRDGVCCKLLIIYGRSFTFPIAATCWAINLHFIDMHTHTQCGSEREAETQSETETERARATIETVRELARFAIFV